MFIRVLLCLNDEQNFRSQSKEEIKRIQVSEFGNIQTKLPPHCLVELLPFPAKNRKDETIIKTLSFVLSDIGVKNSNKTRKSRITKTTYRDYCFSKLGADRLFHLKNKLEEHSPLLVIFYEPELFVHISDIVGVKKKRWDKIEVISNCEKKFSGMVFRTSSNFIYHCRVGSTSFVLTEHPSRLEGDKGEYWRQVCCHLKKLKFKAGVMSPKTSPSNELDGLKL